MTESPGKEYEAAILEQIPRVLGGMDRELYSPTAGCCDRTFWAWKFTDFPGARFQEAVCALSFLFAADFKGNPYYRNGNLLGWIRLALRYWTSIQYRDGSFDEAYPRERSLAAVAFTTFYIGEALGFLGRDLDDETGRTVRESMRRSGVWLTRNDETHGFLSNHLAAAAAALQHVFIQTNDPQFRERSAYFVDRILKHQSPEGWYEEYGGADFGYQTHGCFYLARLHELDPQPALQTSLMRAMYFQALFIHPDSSLGGEYASRNTQTYYPAAFEMFADRNSSAAWIAETMRPVAGGFAAAGLRAVDAYNLFPMLNNLVFALRALRKHGRVSTHPEEPEIATAYLWFPKAGIARIRREAYTAYVGTSKGGVVKLFDRRSRRLVYSDCGYMGRLRNRKLVTSQHFDPNRAAEVTAGGVALTTSFVQVARPVMNPWLFLGFRMFSLTLGQSASLARWLKRVLVNALIYRKNSVEIELDRTIEFHEMQVTIRDRLEGRGLKKLADLQWLPSFATIHMGSSRYFVAHELNKLTEEPHRLDADKVPVAVLERTVRFD